MIGYWRADDEFSWNNCYLIVVKELFTWQKISEIFGEFTDYFLNIIVNMIVNYGTSLLIWDLNITEHYPEILLQVSLKQETKIDERGHGIFSEKITGPWNI